MHGKDVQLEKIRQCVGKQLTGTAFRAKQYIDDLSQEVLIRYLRACTTAVQNPMGYLTRIAEHVCKSFLQEQEEERLCIVRETPARQDGEEEIPLAELIADSEDSPETMVIRAEEREELYRAIHKLPQPWQQVMQLLAEGATCQEISENTGRALSTVHKDIQKGKEQLKVLLSDRKE